MLSLLQKPTRLCDGIRRREVLRAGGLGALGLSLPFLNRQRSFAAESVRPSLPGKAKSCIVLFMLGGPPQHSTFDPKPEAPAEVRGEFGAINSVVPGIELCELWPKTATLTNKIAILRAMSTGDNAHSSSGYYMLTGQPHAPMNAENVNPGFPNDFPNLGASVRKLMPAKGHLPTSVRLPHHIFNTDGSVWPGQDAGFLGRSVEPWLLNCQPADPGFHIDELDLNSDVSDRRLNDRRALLNNINRNLKGANDLISTETYGQLTDKAFDVLSSPKARQAFELNREPDAVRNRYGRSQFGQSVLISRRLVEAGVSLIQVNWFRGPDEPSNAPCWDSHAKEAERLRTVLCPPADQAFSALLEDLERSGRLDETLVVMMAEFGRTPKFNANAGRDHWGHVFSVALAGGGIRGGVVHGASDNLGAFAQNGKVSPADLTATIFHCLGLNPNATIHDTLGRPLPISRGETIRPILA